MRKLKGEPPLKPMTPEQVKKLSSDLIGILHEAAGALFILTDDNIKIEFPNPPDLCDAHSAIKKLKWDLLMAPSEEVNPS